VVDHGRHRKLPALPNALNFEKEALPCRRATAESEEKKKTKNGTRELKTGRGGRRRDWITFLPLALSSWPLTVRSTIQKRQKIPGTDGTECACRRHKPLCLFRTSHHALEEHH